MLNLKSIRKDYVTSSETVHALKGVDIVFRESEFVSILGPSGCGKTTLLNIIGGLDHYTSGDLIIGGRSTKGFSDRDWDVYRNHRIGFIFQSYNLIPHQTVLGKEEHEAMLDCKNDAAALEIAELIRLWSVVNPDRYPTLHDPLAVYYAVHPEVCEVEEQRVKVLTEGYARGLTLNIDAYNKSYMNPACKALDKGNCKTVAKSIDARAFINIFAEVFKDKKA
jgi:ABC-type glutathione transport system ATPase component